MSRSRVNLADRIAQAKARILFAKYKDEEERLQFLNSKYFKFAFVLVCLYLLIYSLIITDVLVSGRFVKDRIISVENKKMISVSRRGGRSSTFWVVMFEKSRQMELDNSRNFRPSVNEDVSIEFSNIFNQPKSIQFLNSGWVVEVESSLFSNLRLIIYSITGVLCIVYFFIYRKGYKGYIDASVGFIAVTIILMVLTIFTK